ncbi:MAG: FAD:protein FMN transferase [Candidatus Omnitrophota bacterium]|jgi:thiamine biosynthesis lipoprotein
MKKYLPIIVALAIFSSACQQAHPLYKDSRLMMGTIIEVISPDKQAAAIAFKEINRIESLLSVFKDDSEIARLNRQGRLRVSQETLQVIKQSGEFWQATQGAFDITAAPLIELWGFYNKKYRIPSDSEIKEKLALIGFDKIKIDGNIIEFKIAGMKIDLAAIAKGFAIDCAVEKLRSAGIESALLNAGGDIYCLGNKFGLPWQVAVRTNEQLISAENLKLKDKAVATSGNYEQYFWVDNVRYCHILNPKTGRPADSNLASVTVIADDCLTTDALATSIFVLGKDKVDELAERFNAQIKIYTDV